VVFSIVLLVLFCVTAVSFALTFALLCNERRHRPCSKEGELFLKDDAPNHLQIPAAKVVAAFVIHSKHRKDREKYIKTLEECLAGLTSLEVVQANDGSLLKNCSIRKSEVGCFLSHMGICKRIASNPEFCGSADNWALIFEDDVIINLSHVETCTQIMQALREFPALTPLAYLGFSEPPKNRLKRVGIYTYVGTAPWALHAYAVRCIHAHKIVSLLSDKICRFPVDMVFHRNVPNAGFVYASKTQCRITPSIYGCGLFAQDESSPTGINFGKNNIKAAWDAYQAVIENLATKVCKK